MVTVAGVEIEMVERGTGRPLRWLHGEDGLCLWLQRGFSVLCLRLQRSFSVLSWGRTAGAGAHGGEVQALRR